MEAEPAAPIFSLDFHVTCDVTDEHLKHVDRQSRFPVSLCQTTPPMMHHHTETECVCGTCSAKQSLPGFDERQDVGVGLLVSGQRGGGGAGGQGSETRHIS